MEGKESGLKQMIDLVFMSISRSANRINKKNQQVF